MKLEFIPVKGQKFDIGRTINPFKCDRVQCDFMHCPKKNYAVKMKRKKYSVDVFWNEWKDEIVKINKPLRWQYSFHGDYKLRLTWSMLNDFFDILYFTFPKNTYWSLENHEDSDCDIENTVYKRITLVKFSRTGKEIPLGHINVTDCDLYDYDLSESQYKLAKKIQENIRAIKEKVFEYYQEKDKEWRIGWLSPEGRHYPCSHVEHSILARMIDGGEYMLETQGWIRVTSEDEDGFLGDARWHPTAEQRNWLSLNGYVLED